MTYTLLRRRVSGEGQKSQLPGPRDLQVRAGLSGNLLRHFGDQRCVDAHWTKAGGTPGRAEWGRAAGKRVMEEGGVVSQMLPLVFRQIDFVVDRTDPASRFAGTAIHALIRIDI